MIATNSVGSISDMAFRIMVRNHHLDDANDMSFVEASLPNMNALLLEKKVDLISGVVPFSLDPTLLAAGAHLDDGRRRHGAVGNRDDDRARRFPA